MIKFAKLNLLLLCTLLFSVTVNSQNTTVNDSLKAKDAQCCKLKLNVGADVVSRYIFRGTDFGNSPAIQPTVALSISNFELGCWGSIATNSFYQEVDLYAKYTLKKFSLMFTDYYIPSLDGSAAAPDTRYFVYGDKKTAHTFETCLMFKGGDKFPLWLQACAFVYGNDKRWGYDVKKDTTEQSYYSSYFEAGYTFSIHQNSLDVFAGFTPTAGAYGNSTGIVNAGITGSRKVKVTNDFELPVKASLIFNPQTSKVFFVFGVSF